ncbi:hypothetical protein GCM10022225_70730 [Plantactinospora mayteni]|uniref:Uncharacterized protein n=1 Tax=Plantactinospora mayteni TaxID=566021 RepID=A0ABQ4EVT3_9ACTN|nr:hypothetical protein [Plantactinospora mayteni]GIG98746.1 hypothetical protein Pma05_53190 [Plantactinospora mayteni]
MTTASPRLFRAPIVLFGTVLALLLTVSTSSAALGSGVGDGSKAGAAVSARTDAFMKDIASDVGNEPHGAIYSSFFNSPDVKICPSWIECASHTNPVVGSTSYIFVKLRNPGPYGSGISSGTLRAYYTTSGGAANWPAHWTPIGSKSLPVAPGETVTSIEWPNVPSIGHFCLLLRWESATDPMNFEGTATSINTQYNNNIVWKNANTVPATPGGPPVDRPYALANALPVPANFDLVFRPADQVVPGVKVVVDLGPELFERWVRGGRAGEGIRVVGRTQLEVDPARAEIRDLLINPEERPVVKLSFSAGDAAQKPYVLQVLQVGPAREVGEKFVLGGVDYTIVSARG